MIDGDAKVAVAYLRVSTEDQHLGPEAQRSAIEAWARHRGVAVVAWFEDRVSGATPVDKRDGMLAALMAVREHRAGLLVAAKRDRVARDITVAAMVERLCEREGAQLATADGVGEGASPEAQLMRGLLDLFASYERALIKTRTRAALGVKRTRGERVSRLAPVGFRFEGDRVVTDDSEQALLARIRTMRERGLSLRRVVDVLAAEGVTLRGGRVHQTTLARCLRRAAVHVA